MIFYLLKVVVVYIVACVPLPNNTSFLVSKIKNCSREESTVVRHFIHSVWRPVFKFHDVKMPEQCPLHYSRDLFARQELSKLHYRANLWTCGLCGKSFYREPYLDLHLHNQHLDTLKWGDRSVCYADYCDVIRCDVLIRNRRKRKNNGVPNIINGQNTLFHMGINIYEDIDFDLDEDDLDPITYSQQEKSQSDKSKAVIAAPPRHVLRALEEKNIHEKSGHFVVGIDSYSEVIQDPLGFGSADEDSKSDGARRSSDSWLSFRKRGNKDTRSRSVGRSEPEMYSKILTRVDRFLRVVSDRVSIKSNPANDDFPNWSDDCDEAEMAAIHNKCKRLIYDCVAPLILQMTDDDYIKMTAKLDKELCWYLTCDKRDLTKGGPPASIPSNFSHFILMTILLCILTTILGIIYYLLEGAQDWGCGNKWSTMVWAHHEEQVRLGC